MILDVKTINSEKFKPTYCEANAFRSGLCLLPQMRQKLGEETDPWHDEELLNELPVCSVYQEIL